MLVETNWECSSQNKYFKLNTPSIYELCEVTISFPPKVHTIEM